VNRTERRPLDASRSLEVIFDSRIAPGLVDFDGEQRSNEGARDEEREREGDGGREWTQKRALSSDSQEIEWKESDCV
jgi:hypothetical protein